MTETENPPEEGIPAGGADYAKIIDELKRTNAALAEKVNALEEKSKGFDQKITALSGEAAKTNAAKKDEIETKKKEFDESYERAMESLGFRVKKE
jgi:outer membrane murein-binding lipoprotein Lpp